MVVTAITAATTTATSTATAAATTTAAEAAATTASAATSLDRPWVYVLHRHLGLSVHDASSCLPATLLARAGHGCGRALKK